VGSDLIPRVGLNWRIWHADCGISASFVAESRADATRPSQALFARVKEACISLISNSRTEINLLNARSSSCAHVDARDSTCLTRYARARAARKCPASSLARSLARSRLRAARLVGNFRAFPVSRLRDKSIALQPRRATMSARARARRGAT